MQPQPRTRLQTLWDELPPPWRSLLSAAAFLVALDVFFVSIKLLSAFKALGAGYGNDLILNLADNPFIGLLIGILVTSVVQSSSSTTSLVVGLVAAGTLGDDPASSVRVAVPIIMGANIGTSVTNTLVSFGHVGDPREFKRAYAAATVHDFFNLMAVCVFLPLQAATNFLGRLALAMTRMFEQVGGLSFVSPLKLLVKPQQALVKALVAQHPAAAFVIATVVTLVALHLLTTLGRRTAAGQPTLALRVLGALGAGGVAAAMTAWPGVTHSPELATLLLALSGLFGALYSMVRIMRTAVLTRIERLFHDYLFKTATRAFLLGALFTALVQSSSVTTSLVVPLAGAGLLQLAQVFPYTLGANVGTTVTAMLAALSLGDAAAVAVATAHLLFNLLGIVVFWPLRKVPMSLAQRLAALSVAWPAAAPLFVVLVFFVIPLCLIFGAR